MSKYISLNAHTQLEQAIAYDLKAALEKRGFTVLHRGTEHRHAPGGKPDIVVFGKEHVLTFEVTTSRNSAQDREFQSIRGHLKAVKAENPEKQCFCFFVSPKTSNRTLDSMFDHNQQRERDGLKDMKIIPLPFDLLDIWVSRLSESAEDQYPVEALMRLTEQHGSFVDDFIVLKALVQSVFPTDANLKRLIKEREYRCENKKPKSLARDLILFENQIRESRINKPDDDIALYLWDALFTDRYLQSFHRVSKATGLSVAQYDLLDDLFHEGECSISDISERFDITNAAASQLVDKLVQSGLVERAEDPSNRRAKTLNLTDKGTSLVAQGMTERHRWMEDVTKSLSTEDQKKIIEALDILTEAARKVEK